MPSHDAASQKDAHAQDAQSSNPQPRTEQELSQAFRDLARGEQTAAALEANLTSLESKLDELLASFMSKAGEDPQATNGADRKEGGGTGAQGGKNMADK
ncbi:hypothetical protein VSDG_02262 [Cytospora chrysosperma]|uniref:Uncharacterized protein n=1 Tax=Cytospora chrysosperma TaxID=252740 RepID=A0A423WDJ5_CYTCH|nr:hypothetical protein VSDG_02262 [Valsa sordida]